MAQDILDPRAFRFRNFLYREYTRFSRMPAGRRTRLTPLGWALVAALGATAVMGANTNESTAYQLFSLLAAMCLVSWLASRRFKPDLEVTRVAPGLGSAGQRLRYRVTVRNCSDRHHVSLRLKEWIAEEPPSRDMFLYQPEPLEASRNRFDRTFLAYRWMWLKRRLRRANAWDTESFELEPGGTVEVEIAVTPLRRGVLKLEQVLAQHPDPFGIWICSRRLDTNSVDSIVVLPQRYPVPPLMLGGESRYQPSGVALAGSVGQSEEFVGLRDYRAGDALRHIHWKSWARTGSPIVMEFEDEFVPRYALVLDAFAAYDRDGRFEAAVSVAASFACTLDTQDSLLDLMFIGTEAYCITSGRGTSQPEHLLEVLAAVELCRDRSFDDLSELVLSHARVVSACICIFLEWDNQRADYLRRLLAQRVDVLPLLIQGHSESLPSDAVGLGVRAISLEDPGKGLAVL